MSARATADHGDEGEAYLAALIDFIDRLIHGPAEASDVSSTGRQ